MSRYGAKLIDAFGQLRGSYGFVPALMTVGALFLAALALQVPDSVGNAVADIFGLPPSPKAESMRDLIGLIASATIGTGGVAFSMMVAATVTAATQYGPRLLTNFLADRATQLTLGVFVATFVYAVVVYAAIRDDNVRSFAGLIAMLLALASVAALVYFLHHAPATLRINHAISSIGGTLLANIETRFPANCGQAARGKRMEPPPQGEPTQQLLSAKAGILSIIDGERLAEEAAAAGVVVVIRARPGQFLSTGQAMADVYGPILSDRRRNDMVGQFALAKLRTPSQDNEFLADELVEIALRALSPGINDPVTASACFDWLGASLGRVAGSEPPTAWRGPQDRSARIYAQPLAFPAYLERTFGRIRQPASGNVHAAEAFLRGLATIGVEGRENTAAMRLVVEQARALLAQAELALAGPDLESVHLYARRFDAVLAERPVALDKFAPADE